MRVGSIFLASLIVLSPWVAGGQQRPKSPPDIFLITIDTLRADHVGCYGDHDIQTPALDSLARQGIRYAQAFTPSPITNTSHTTILTGLLPSSHGVTDFAIPLNSSHSTLAELLKKNGYHTAAFIGAVILDSKSLAPGLDRGFDFYDNFPQHSPSKSRWGRVERRGEDVVGRSEKWLNTHLAGPHFTWVHLYDPHDPYEPPPPYSRSYKDRLYDGEIAYTDNVLQGFLRYLKNRGWYENAIIVVVGDHGEGLGEHDENTHGIFLYDSTTHVPLIVKLPHGRYSGQVVDVQVRTTDIVPTILDSVGIPKPDKLDGVSLQTLYAGKPQTERVVFGETDYPLRFGWAPLRSVRAHGAKFIEAPRPEFYDLHTDPSESKNMYAPWDDAVQKMRAMLAEIRSKAPPATTAATVPTGTIDELKALGYLGQADVGSSTTVPEPSLLPDPKDKIQEQNLLHTAMMAEEDGRPSQARAGFERVLQIDAKSPTALRELGELEFKAGDFPAAAEHLKSAREARPNDATAGFFEGQARSRTGDFTGARNALEASLKLSPGQLPARILLGNAYLELKDPKAAEDQFEAALVVDSTNLEAGLGLARSQMANGNAEEALKQIVQLSRLHPDSPEVFELLAQTYKTLGKTQEAQQAEYRARRLRGRRLKQLLTD